MAGKDAATPRVFLIRHGETEWSLNGRYTGTTDLPLLPSGETKIRQTASVVVGPGKLIDPSRLARVYCSPRQRATRTLDLLLLPTENSTSGSPFPDELVTVTEEIREWTYADYEGLLTHEILALRKERGHDAGGRKWKIWTHGSEGPGSESPRDVASRVDGVIDEITALQGKVMEGGEGGDKDGLGEEGRKDVLIVAHGHILRAFVKRWLRFDIGMDVEFMLEPGGVCGLSYYGGDVNRRALLCGMSFPAA